MAGLDELLYKWIVRANSRRDDLDLPVGLIEESIALLKATLGREYLEHLLIEDTEPVPFIDEEANPLQKWLLSAAVDEHIIQTLELCSYFKAFREDPALPEKVNKLKFDKFWPAFFELAMAARVKTASTTSEKVVLSLEPPAGIGDFIISMDGVTTPCECSRLGRSPQILEPRTLEEGIVRRIRQGTEKIDARLCIKLESGEALTGKVYNRILRLIRLGLADCRRSLLPTTHRDGLITVTFEQLTELSEQFPLSSGGWTSALSIQRVFAQSMEEVQARFDAGERFREYEAVRLLMKFRAGSNDDSSYTRLTAKLKKKLKQTKTSDGHCGKVVFIDVPFDLRTIHRTRLFEAIRAAAANSQTTLAIILTSRENNPHMRYHYSQTGFFNPNAAPGKPDVIERINLLRRVEKNESRVDLILGTAFRRSWAEAQDRERKIRESYPSG